MAIRMGAILCLLFFMAISIGKIDVKEFHECDG